MPLITKHPGLRGLGLGLSALWLVLALVLLSIVGKPGDAGALGSFLGGAAAPLALLWLVLGFVAQTREFSQRAHDQEDAMETARKQVEEIQNQTGFQNMRELFFTYLDEANRLRRQVQDVPPDDKEYRLIRGLQPIALAAYTGGLNLGFLLGSNGPQSVRTWMDCLPHTRDEVRKNMNDRSGRLPFSRRHAEWLALLAWLWTRSKASTYELQDEYGKALAGMDGEYGGSTGVLERETRLFQADEELVHPATKRIREVIREAYSRGQN